MPDKNTQLEFHGQFVLYKDDCMNPVKHFQTTTAHGWTLCVHSSLCALDVTTHKGVKIGWMIGTPVSPNGVMADEKIRLPPGVYDLNKLHRTEEYLYSFTGRFIFILVSADSCRVYLDPLGSLAAVYSREEPVVASTTTLIEYYARIRARYSVEEAPELKPNDFYPAGLTSCAAIGRILPNHFLDLIRGRLTRHWPTTDIERYTTEQVPGRMRELGHEIRKTALAVASRYNTYVSLTAGEDTRCILASVRGETGQFHFFTFSGSKEGARVDKHIAVRLAREFGLKHSIIPVDISEPGLFDEYLYKIGYDGAPGKSKHYLQASRKYFDLNGAIMTGHIGARTGWHIRNRLRGDKLPKTPEHWLRVLCIGDSPARREAIRNWVNALQTEDPFLIIDLLYHEMRSGCWYGPHTYGFAPFAAIVNPFTNRRIIEIVTSKPAVDGRDLSQQELVRLLWPQLMSRGFNEESGIFATMVTHGRKLKRALYRKP